MRAKIFYLAFLSISIVSCQQKENLFASLPASQTHVDFTNVAEKHKLFNILYYLYYYNGGGVATGDINNDGLPDIYFAANSKGHNKLYLNKGNFEFEDITAKAGVAGTSDWCTGVTMADVNNDGYLDLYVSAVAGKYDLKGHNELFLNNKNGTFTESAGAYGLDFSGFTTQTAFFDYDHDGDLDCYILNQSHHPHANIADTAHRRSFDSLSGDRFYRNDLIMNGKKGVAHFTDVSKQTGIFQSNLGYGLGIAVADMNNDGWDDIYIGNDFHENDYYYINNGDGTFTESGAQHFKHYSRFSMGNDVADYNNDGQPDVVTVDMLPPDEKVLKTYGSDENPDIYKVKLEINGYQYQYSKNCLQRNNGDGASFSETSLQSGMAATDWSWSPLFADFDNDGKKDLFISSGIVKRPVDLDYIRFASDLKNKGMDKTDKYDEDAINAMPDGSSHPFLFKGDGKLSFRDVSEDWGTAKLKGYFNGAAYADLDADGNPDLIINCLNAPAVILKNNAPKKHTASISFHSDSTNIFGVGAKAYLFTRNGLQYQQLMPTRGFMSSSDLKLNFGLDTLASVDSILVVWPNQRYQLLRNVPVNGRALITFDQKNASGTFDYYSFFPKKQVLFQDITSEVNCNWKHKEDDFVDFNVQYLIPHEQSTRGPKLAVGDVNKDGLDDFYVCGARLQPGALMIQQANGSFAPSDTALFNRYAAWEDLDATFFDANNDGYPDLYVVSGGNEYEDGNALLGDRLFLNDGKGHFNISATALPVIYTNKSTVSIADVDKDGDNDLFVGGLAGSKSYGILQPSYLLLNDGKGNFRKADHNTIALDSTGIVTTSSFADINNDGWADLIVAGEWMPVKIFINNKGKFTASDLNASTGLCQSVYTADVNGDGFTDILAGNWGHNNKFWSGKNGPVKMYVKDFDGNGSIEQVVCYTVNGEEYTFLAKDELERSLPVLKKAYLAYSEVAGKNVQYMFYDLFKGYREYKAETLSSSCFINDGKGNFTRTDLPDEMQFAPVFNFTSVQQNQQTAFMATGNFYGVVPYEGRYDALLPTLATYNKNAARFDHPVSLPAIDGEVRDAKWINTAKGKIMAIARNNKGIVFLKPATE